MENSKLAAIHFTRVSKSFTDDGGVTRVIRDLSLTLNRHGFYSFLGVSGSGKTTLLNLIAGLSRPTSGTIAYDSGALRPRVGYVFQEDRLLPWKKVWENLDIVLEPLGLPPPQRRQMIRSYLQLIGLESRAGFYPSALSGGEKQRINLIRSLCVDPEIILMDEPFSHLDEITAAALRSEVSKMWEKKKILTVLVTHNILEAIYLSDKIFVVPGRYISAVKEIKVGIPRPRTAEPFDRFIFRPEVRTIADSIRRILPVK